MKNKVIGILADVDAGKTTLSEALLFLTGTLRKIGRVDHGNAFLDTHSIEKSRGITVFAKQAVFNLSDTHFTLLDTPGHADFTAETERTLQSLDCAVLLINACDGVAPHTETLWKLLKKRNVPTLIFVNKMDLAGADKTAVAEDMRKNLDPNIVDFTLPKQARDENAAMCDEILLEAFDENGELTDSDIADAVARRALFPCCFGSALKSDGVEALLALLAKFTPDRVYGKEFAAQVYKIERDQSGKRMTCMKITGGSLKVRDVISYRSDGGEQISEKVNGLRIYSGGRFEAADEVFPGEVCAAVGLSATYAGQGLGAQADAAKPLTQPVMTYRVIPPDGCDSFTLLEKLRELQEEDPGLHVTYSEQLDEIGVQLMGEIQTEILRSIVSERFGLDIAVDSGRILYRETIAAPIEGVGHFEPLRHYAEVHLILTPLPRGSGIRFETSVSEDRLDRNWQNLIIGSLQSKTHVGVLTGSPITDMKITLSAGRAHRKHTEGGDFRQAAWRAVRQGLMKAESLLLEPYYSFTLTVPSEQAGRALNDIQSMGGEFSQPETAGDMLCISGKAPVSAMKNYAAEVVSYTRGRGRFSCEVCGYEVCKNSEEVIRAAAYQAEADLENTADSVFCSHGAGHTVSWREVEEHMHLEPTLVNGRTAEPVKKRNYSISEDELERIMEKIAPKREFKPQEDEEKVRAEIRRSAAPKVKPEVRPRLLIVDGYNIIFAWEELRELAAVNIDAACDRLADILSNYAGFKKLPLLLVFDAYKTPAVRPHKMTADGIEVVYTKSGQTCDAFIEAFCSENRKKYRIRVATNDGMIQLSIMSLGALRMTANELKNDVDFVNGQIAEILKNQNKNRSD